MAKADYICKNCKEVQTEHFFKTLYKYMCPQCGTICEKCIDTYWFKSPTCKKCGSKVLSYIFKGGRWTKF